MEVSELNWNHFITRHFSFWSHKNWSIVFNSFTLKKNCYNRTPDQLIKSIRNTKQPIISHDYVVRMEFYLESYVPSKARQRKPEAFRLTLETKQLVQFCFQAITQKWKQR